ncbi:hypothetical protein H0H93_007923 [Arthromyces matolae]|nr:hypothetical protein H0H93_007923 [Arthromyces matolae]
MPTETLHKFMVYAPDFTAEGTFEKRLSVRAEHLKEFKAKIDSGFVRVGGVLLSAESIAAEATDKKMVGSLFICEAKDIEEVKKIVESDIYYQKGVWDVDRIVISPILPAVGF